MDCASQAPNASALIIDPLGCKTYNFPGYGEVQLLITGEHSAGEWWLGSFREDPGFVTQLHLHAKMRQQFYVLKGVLSLYVDNAWHELRAGMLAAIPQGVPHAQGNLSDKAVHFLGSGSPSGFEEIFPAVDRLIKQGIRPPGPLFFAEFEKIAAECDMQILGPPPARL